ncbi:basic amino acid/polyamine antiporter [Cumulibacter soli]|uniref:basic amino acid/polyamine antiporter n=1 Tax=Cumulibacter soli TaxID=2546344 RepID=UPI001068773A|nr:basic amino acid/polyamine antiporter [Cumulibacter soli]
MSATTGDALAADENKKPVVKLSMLAMTGMVVGSMVGAGVFSLPGRFARETGVAGALIAWLIAGAGMLMLAFVFQLLAVRKPKLDAGVYAYAKAGFGDYLGFFSGVGYWASACAGNTFYWVFIMSTLTGLGVGGLDDGDTVLAVLISSAGLWAFYALIRRGVQGAAFINTIVTIAKLIPIVFFVILCATVFDPAAFAENWGGADYAGSLFEQIRGTMLVTVFVFLGVEGASVYSRHAKNRADVGRATILGFLSVFAVFASVTIVSYGVMPMAEIAQLQQPSMAGVLEHAVGTRGRWFVSIGLIVSVLGAYLAWSLMSAEVLSVAAEENDMPRFLGKLNRHGVPSNAVLLSSSFVQVLLLVMLLAEDALDLALDLTSSLTLIPFLLAALYAVKLVVTRDGYDLEPAGIKRDRIVAFLAVIYSVFLIFAAGVEFLLLSFVIYAPATVLFVMARREQQRRVFARHEAAIFAVAIVVAVIAVIALASGWIAI